MVEETIHVMDANETTSEAFKNYAGAALLIGMAILAIGVGAGMVSQSIRSLRKAKAPTAEDLLDRLRRSASEKAGHTVDDVRSSAVESLRKVTEELMGGRTFDQVKSEDDVLYYVKKAYKDPVNVGDMLPEQFVVAKPDGMPMEVFMHQDNVKFKSKVTVEVPGGMNLIAVEEIVNSDTVKPV